MNNNPRVSAGDFLYLIGATTFVLGVGISSDMAGALFATSVACLFRAFVWAARNWD